jgi:hypothetical protein
MVLGEQYCDAIPAAAIDRIIALPDSSRRYLPLTKVIPFPARSTQRHIQANSPKHVLGLRTAKGGPFTGTRKEARRA